MGESTVLQNRSQQRLKIDLEFKIQSYLDGILANILIPD